VTDAPQNLTLQQLSEHPLWTPPEGSAVTLLPAANAAGVALAYKDNQMATGTWTVSKLLLLPDGGNLPVGFGVAIDGSFSRQVFLQQLAAQHGQVVATHAEAWMKGPWCDSWFTGIARATKSFVLTMLSWSQIRDTLTPLIPPGITGYKTIRILHPHMAGHSPDAPQ